ncbi:MAG TPA: type II toxin-antitoxin system VapC family toxin [Anaerolineales bacterium]|nr:type II toxin-antitoxin system VapC family toxin [Anaerolineales bacterium]
MIVVDTNIIGYLYLTSEYSEQVEVLYRKEPLWTAPLLWRSELRNVLAYYLRKKLLSLSDASRVMDAATGLLGGREYQVPSMYVLELVTKSSCSAYDCEFVALAQALKTPLVTVDRQILEQFPALAVSLDDYLAARRR